MSILPLSPFPGFMFGNTVYVDTTPATVSAMGGVQAPQTPPGVAMQASVQLRSTQRRDRNVGGGATEPQAVQRAKVYFRADPGVKQGSMIWWPPNVRLNVLGPAIDQAGYGVLYCVECEVIS